MKKEVAILFARKDSIYKQIECCDVYDIDRDARNYPGGLPIVAHPPCRAWGQLAHMANPRPGERELAIWAVDQIRQFGGVLEHPAGSRLWKEKELPRGLARDEWGGFSISIDQFWFGHKARKRTLLYIVGVEPSEIPSYPIIIGEPTHVIDKSKKRKRSGCKKKYCTISEREHTPERLAEWLVDLAKMCALNSITIN